MALITTKFDSICKDCGATIPAGSKARYYGPGRLYGLTCHEQITRQAFAEAKAKGKGWEVRQETAPEVAAPIATPQVEAMKGMAPLGIAPREKAPRVRQAKREIVEPRAKKRAPECNLSALALRVFKTADTAQEAFLKLCKGQGVTPIPGGQNDFGQRLWTIAEVPTFRCAIGPKLSKCEDCGRLDCNCEEVKS